MSTIYTSSSLWRAPGSYLLENSKEEGAFSVTTDQKYILNEWKILWWLFGTKVENLEIGQHRITIFSATAQGLGYDAYSLLQTLRIFLEYQLGIPM